MKFSECFNVKRERADDWFDPVLSVDTPLFFDPFLVYAREDGLFAGSHGEIIAFFNCAFRLVAEAGGRAESPLYRKAVSDLRLPEVEELCLGYTQAGTKGSGSGGDFAKLMAEAIWEAIKNGITEVKHFEEIAILREGIGADRISDITGRLLRARLASYTCEVCARHGVGTEPVRYVRGSYDAEAQRWQPLETALPMNPYNGKPVLLVPRRYLRDLPTINADDFWDYCCVNENEIIRNEFNLDVSRRVCKAEIIALARRHPEVRRAYLQAVELRGPQPYDLERDRKGVVLWYDATRDYCAEHKLALPVESEEAFTGAVAQMVDAFRIFVEKNAGWRLLWNDNGTSRSENAAQLLFLGIVKHHCRANNIDISREPNIGRGPVDFKVSAGYSLRVLLELKLAHNTRFWNGLTRQLPEYLLAEDIRAGYFIVVVFNDADLQKVNDIRQIAVDVSKRLCYRIEPLVVDARPEKPSASRL